MDYQLTRADYPNVAPFNAEVHQWNYDAIGNRLANTINGVPQNYSYFINPGNSNNGQRLQSDGTNTYTYDNNGNTITKSGPGGNFTFTYDYENRLIAISGATTASYTYDFIGRRSSKNVGGTTTFIYNGQDLIAERGTLVADFVFGPRIDEPLAMRRSSTTYYFDVDVLGSVNLINNNAGTIQNKYVFDAWGVTRNQSTTILNLFSYTGREIDEADHLYYRLRYYNPRIGKFTKEDPVRILGRVHRYKYAENNPIRYIDPSGGTIRVQGDENAFAMAVGYLSQDPGMRVIIEALKSSSYDILIITGEESTLYLPGFGFITWDPYTGLSDHCGNKISPALTLGHELAHAFNHLLIGTTFLTDATTLTGDDYHTVEEMNVILGAERDAARTLGEGERVGHDGYKFPVSDPTSNKDLREKD